MAVQTGGAAIWRGLPFNILTEKIRNTLAGRFISDY